MRQTLRICRFLTAVVIITAPIIACQEGSMDAGNTGPKNTVLPIPLPEGTHIVAPGPDVPADIAAFSGVWGGYWGSNGTPSLLIVERVYPSGNVTGVYAWGALNQLKIVPGSLRFRSRIANGTLSWGSVTKFEFTKRPDGTLHGARYVSGWQQAGDVIMTKVPLSATALSTNHSEDDAAPPHTDENASSIPLPPDIRIVAPGPEVPPAIAAFSGRWGPNRWNGNQLSHILIVEEIKPSGAATVIYAYGDWSAWNIKANSIRLHATFTNGTLKVALPNGAEAEYTIDKIGGIDGTYFPKGGMIATITMAKSGAP